MSKTAVRTAITEPPVAAGVPSVADAEKDHVPLVALHRLQVLDEEPFEPIAFEKALELRLFAQPAAIGPWKRIVQFVPDLSSRQIVFSAEQLWLRDYGPIAHRMIAEHPLVGVGLGGFNYLYADMLYLMSGSERPPDNAQNWYRQQLTELGVLGSAGLVM